MDYPPPNPSKRTKRLPKQAKYLQPGENLLCSGLPTAKCVRAYGVSRKWLIVQRLERDGKVRVWRIS